MRNLIAKTGLLIFCLFGWFGVWSQDLNNYLVYNGSWSNLASSSYVRTEDSVFEDEKVGLVLSGGGAKGLAHIGVIRALEENNIPIDYIVGTSMGAIVGGMYAIGLNPDQMEALVNTDEFQSLATGNIEDEYKFYFMQEDPNPSWLSLKVAKDSIWETTLPTNLINSVGIDFLFLEHFSGPAAASGYNFDNLLIPFRCVAADIESKKEVVFREGHLNTAIRASATFPFYLKPISIDGKLLFDGGLYNNFPTDIMYNEFFPDIIIGSNVAGQLAAPSADNVLSQIRNMLIRRSEYTVICDNGILIEPKGNVGIFSFSNAQTMIDSGYSATIAKMPEIKMALTRRMDQEVLEQRRKRFREKQPPLKLDQVYVDGLNKRQATYVRKLLSAKKNEEINLSDIKYVYFRVFEDDRINTIFPQLEYNKFTNLYDLYLDITKDKEIQVDLGGVISSRPISGAYLKLKYNHLGSIGVSANINGSLGKLYTSAQIKTRLDFPIKLPLLLEPVITYNRWDYFKSSTDFFDNETPSYLVQKEKYFGLEIGFPNQNKGRVRLGSNFANLRDEYYQTKQFDKLDTADRTDFNVLSSHIRYEKNSLNRKQYANQGSYLGIKVIHNIGEEIETPGSTSTTEGKWNTIHEWVQIKIEYNSYYKNKGFIRLGTFFEGVYSGQSLFHNYTSSILRAPSFQPNPESKTLFLESFRAYKYGALGQRIILNLRKNVDLRFEGYLFHPYQSIVKQDNTVSLGDEFDKIYSIATATLVYHSPLGPLSLSTNYYHNTPEIAQESKTPLTFFFHFGYILFNKRAIE